MATSEPSPPPLSEADIAAYGQMLALGIVQNKDIKDNVRLWVEEAQAVQQRLKDQIVAGGPDTKAARTTHDLLLRSAEENIPSILRGMLLRDGFAPDISHMAEQMISGDRDTRRLVVLAVDTMEAIAEGDGALAERAKAVKIRRGYRNLGFAYGANRHLSSCQDMDAVLPPLLKEIRAGHLTEDRPGHPGTLTRLLRAVESVKTARAMGVPGAGEWINQIEQVIPYLAVMVDERKELTGHMAGMVRRVIADIEGEVGDSPNVSFARSVLKERREKLNQQAPGAAKS